MKENIMFDTVFDDNSIEYAYLCNGYECSFIIGNEQFFSVDQYMKYQFALIMEDEKTAKAILQSKKRKELEHVTIEIDEKLWYKWAVERSSVLLRGTYEKFKQNLTLRTMLFSANGQIAYISMDKYLGIGMLTTDNRIPSRSGWLGENMLGYTLMFVKRKLLKEQLDFAEKYKLGK